MKIILEVFYFSVCLEGVRNFSKLDRTKAVAVI